MALQSKQAIIEQLSQSARKLKTVRDAAQAQRDINALGEPSPITPTQTGIAPGSVIGPQGQRSNPS